MKRIITPLLILGLAASSQATEVGLGFGIQHGTNTIYVPVKLNNGMIIEGFASYWNQRESIDPDTTYSRYGRGETNVGFGIFWTKSITPNSHLYFGPRLGYLRSVQDYQSSNMTSNGYGIAPTLGFEYFPVKCISIGGEAGVSYSNRSEILSDSQPNPIYSRRTKTLSTVSSVMVRVYF